MTTATATRDEQAHERFDRDTAGHEMMVLRDDGLYRHLRFQKPGTSCYYFDLVTWPGHLVISGDMGDYHFTRLKDMFDFFDAQGYGINPYYWGEKLRGPRPGRDGAKSYSHEAFREHVHSWADDQARYGNVEMYPSLLREAVDREILHDYTTHPEEAHERLRAVEDELGDHDLFADSWEWDLRDFDFHYLWCCWAIVRGIEQYRAAKASA